MAEDGSHLGQIRMSLSRHTLRLPDYKDLSLSTTRIKPASLPKEVTLFLRQHEGLPAYPVVKAGEYVRTGTLIAAHQGEFSASLHASISGKVREITESHIRIESDGRDELDESIKEQSDWQDLPRESIIRRIREAGIVGMGGGGFPTHLKIAPPDFASFDLLIINGCESEPFVTSDYVLMLAHATEILHGANLLLRASGASRCVIAIEDNKIDCIEILLSRARGMHLKNVEVNKLKSRYPQGSEPVLVRSVLPKHLRQDVRALVLNVATVFAIYEAVRFRKPLIERVVTVTGQCLVQPQNLLCRIGTTGESLVCDSKGFLREPRQLIYGGPMNGTAVRDLSEPITKTVAALLALPPELVRGGKESPCSRCGLCVEACPEFLVPEMLVRAISKKEHELASEFQLSSCTECGNCEFICPSKIPMVDILQEGKQRLSATHAFQ